MNLKSLSIGVVFALGGVGGSWAALSSESVATRVHDLVSRFRKTQPRLRAAGATESFKEVDVTNSGGTLVAVMGSDDVGAGTTAVFDANGYASAGTIVDTDGSGAVLALDSTGAAGYAMHGSLGFLSFGGDVAEVFPSAEDVVPKGSVMCLDPRQPGSLRVAAQPYDRRVAGVVSGARDYRSGLTLRGLAPVRRGVSVTLSGSVYCLASAVNGAVRVGDLLTTSAVPGHAMRASDPGSSQGAILGKAMEDLPGRSGLILVLASLQ